MTFIPQEPASVILSDQFTDDGSLAIDLGDYATDGYVRVDMSLSIGSLGETVGYLVVISASPTGIGTPELGGSIQQVYGDAPLLTVHPELTTSGTSIQINLVGSGPGNTVDVRYVIDTTLPRP